MPNYHYQCSNCGHSFEIVRSIKEPILKRCPNCKKHKLETIIHSIFISIKKDPKTVGHLAGNNRDKMSLTELADRQEKEESSRIKKKKKPKKPWWRESEKPLDLKKVKNVKKYIETGNKD